MSVRDDFNRFFGHGVVTDGWKTQMIKLENDSLKAEMQHKVSRILELERVIRSLRSDIAELRKEPEKESDSDTEDESNCEDNKRYTYMSIECARKWSGQMKFYARRLTL